MTTENPYLRCGLLDVPRPQRALIEGEHAPSRHRAPDPAPTVMRPARRAQSRHRAPEPVPASWRVAEVRALAGSGEARRIRVAAGVPCTVVAERCGAAAESVRSWESGRSRPSHAHALRYGRVLDALRAEVEHVEHVEIEVTAQPRTAWTLDEVVLLADVRRWCVTGEAQRIREAAHLDRSTIAADVGVSATAVLRWERGDRRPSGAPALRYGALLDRLRSVCDEGVPDPTDEVTP